MPKPELYALLARAEAAVLPSLVDNLPNTVIESLLLGIPVIGTRGASIDELVRDGINGELVERGDAPALANALIRVWRGESPVRKGFVWQDGMSDEMQPQRALANLLDLGRGSRVVAVPPPTELSPSPCGLSPQARA
jgi:glycosyltransferase involved in cell wall biosynthesis